MVALSCEEKSFVDKVPLFFPVRPAALGAQSLLRFMGQAVHFLVHRDRLEFLHKVILALLINVVACRWLILRHHVLRKCIDKGGYTRDTLRLVHHRRGSIVPDLFWEPGSVMSLVLLRSVKVSVQGARRLFRSLAFDRRSSALSRSTRVNDCLVVGL